ncbi:MAG: hypothetical protein J7K45_02805 [Thaumarchaeota archaeon]|nr:hypothetical protein [Nitrososphaerota archaeon]
MRRLIPILLIFAYMWATIIPISFFLLKVVANMPEVFPKALEPVGTATLKVAIGAILFVVWVLTSKAIVEGYVKRKLKAQA